MPLNYYICHIGWLYAAAIWTPEKNKGEAVRVRLALPITIRLQ